MKQKTTVKNFVAILFTAIIVLFGIASAYEAARPVAESLRSDIQAQADPGIVLNNAEKAFFNNIPFNNQWATIDNASVYYLTGYLPNQQVIFGEKGWLFYGDGTDGSILEDYMDGDTIPAATKENIANNLQKIQDGLAQRGIKFAVVVAPNKGNVYSQYMPSGYERVSDRSRCDFALDYIAQNTEVNLIYPKEELLSLCGEYELYYPYDTHWNELGAFIATQQIQESWGLPRSYLQDQTIEAKKWNQDDSVCALDLANMLGLRVIFSGNAIEYRVQKRNTSFDWLAYHDFTSEPEPFQHIYNEDAVYDKSILIIGDSFRSAPLPAVSYLYKDTYVIHRSDWSPKMLEQIQPDGVALFCVERYFETLEWTVVV